MINNFFLLLLKTIISKIYIIIYKKNFKTETYEYNFQNIIFEDLYNLKKVFLSEKYFLKKYLDERSYTYHSFDYLKIGKIIGGARNVSLTKKHIFNWSNKKYSKLSFVWSVKFLVKRFINLIYSYDFYAISATNNEKGIMHKIILEHYLLIVLENKNKKINLITLEELKALILGSLIYNRNSEQFIDLIPKLIDVQIDKNGFHKSYCPSQQTEFINHLYEIKNILLFFKGQNINNLNYQILNMSSLLISLLHKDNSLALFNGSNNTHIKKINEIINIAKDIKPKVIHNIKNGISIYSDLNKKIFMDIVKPKKNLLHKNIHAGTLSFEFSCQNEKIITNCGSLEKRIGKKPEYLRYSAAHSTIIINNTNITELVEKKSYKRSPKNIPFEVFDSKNYIVWKASHDGYLGNFQKIIKRNLYIAKNKKELFGKDTIMNIKANSKNAIYNIRFHLMPDCNCLVSNNKKSVLIKTKKNQAWLFKTNSTLSLEDSIYIGGGKKIEQNKQIVISGTIKSKTIVQKWSLIKHE